MLEYIRILERGQPLDRRWEPNLVRIAVQRAEPNYKVLEWLLKHLPQDEIPLLKRDVVLHAKRGDLNMVQ